MDNYSEQDDALLSTAFSLYSNPGAYAALIGAGVSSPSGILTAWGVLEDLVERVAELSGAEPDDPVAWYQGQYGEKATYEGVLERIAPTQLERQRLLRSYFEPDETDREAGRKIPTLAHRSLARLVRAGSLRIIMTLNFDRLIEQALRAEGIEPTIVASTEDAVGLAPLHTLDCCVIHLHGDYLSPTSMLNTVEELREYRPATAKLLQAVLENYGLIISGWSSRYDPALRSAIAEHYPARYTLTWFEPWTAGEEARNLIRLKQGRLVALDADSGFGHLADGVAALQSKRSRHPLTVSVAVESAKRELSGRTVAIGLHDTVKRELARLNRIPELQLAKYDDDSDYLGMLDRVEEASKVCGALLATLSYWGDESTDAWWIDELPRFSSHADGSGLTKLLSLRVVPGSVLFYATGVAAVASGRFDLLKRLFSLTSPARSNGTYNMLSNALDAEAGYYDIENAGARHFRIVAPLLAEALSLGPEALDDVWQRFELLRLTWCTVYRPAFAQLRAEFFEKNAEMNKIAAELRGVPGPTAEMAKEIRRQEFIAQQSQQEVLGRIMNLVWVGRPHVLTADRMSTLGYQSVVALRLEHELREQSSSHPLVTSGFIDDMPGFLLATQAVSKQLGQIGRSLALSRSRTRAGTVPMVIWLDSEMTPEELKRNSSDSLSS